MISRSYNVLQKRLILKNKKKISPGKYAMLLYVAVSIRWISIRFDFAIYLYLLQVYDCSPAPGRIPVENGMLTRRENPHKYLLYKPTLPQLFVFLASGYKELPPNGALLLYISADGFFPIRPQPEETGYDLGGVLMLPKHDVEPPGNKSMGHVKEHCCLYPGDLFPFTRRPTFLIVDSDNSLAFSSIPHHFDMPLVVLMSPQSVPSTFQGKNKFLDFINL